MASHSIENGLHIAKLRVVDAKRSMEGDTDEAATLLEACRHDGFFHLDIRTTGPEISLCVERMYELEEKLYSLPYEEKMLYDIDNLSELKLNGYLDKKSDVHAQHLLTDLSDTSLSVATSEASEAKVMVSRRTRYVEHHRNAL